MPAGSITGQVYDADLNVPIEYANVVLRSLRDSSQVNGTVTDQSGRFTLPREIGTATYLNPCQGASAALRLRRSTGDFVAATSRKPKRLTAAT